jgi:hypothetical protein
MSREAWQPFPSAVLPKGREVNVTEQPTVEEEKSRASNDSLLGGVYQFVSQPHYPRGEGVE